MPPLCYAGHAVEETRLAHAAARLCVSARGRCKGRVTASSTKRAAGGSSEREARRWLQIGDHRGFAFILKMHHATRENYTKECWRWRMSLRTS